MILNTEFIIIEIPLAGYNPPDIMPVLANLEVALNLMDRVNVCELICSLFHFFDIGSIISFVWYWPTYSQFLLVYS